MSTWRRIALERFPELRAQIQSAESIMVLWIELGYVFDGAYEGETANDDLIRRIWDYAWWCVEESVSTSDAATDPFSAVMVAFFEHVPNCAAARRDLRRWLTPEQFTGFLPVLSYLLSPSEVEDLKEEFQGKPISRRRGKRKSKS